MYEWFFLFSRTGNEILQELSKKELQKKRKADALAFAKILYDAYKEKKLEENAIIRSGQNNAQRTSSN